MNLEDVLFLWLKKLGIPIKEHEVYQYIINHPEYPSALCITDTLRFINVDSCVLEVEMDSLKELPKPYLAHLVSNDGEFVMIKSSCDEIRNFENIWSGIVVLAEVQSNGRKNEKVKNRWSYLHRLSFILVLSYFTINFLTVFLNPEFYTSVTTLVSALGIYISFLIVTKDLGINFRVVDKLCGESSCDDLIKNDRPWLPFGAQIGDLSLTWFIVLNILSLLSTVSSLSVGIWPLLCYLPILGAAVGLISIYYQAMVVKKWCKLCLIVCVLLGIQAAMALKFMLEWPAVKVDYVAVASAIFFIALVICLMIKHAISTFRTIEQQMYQNSRFKYKPEVFKALLNRTEHLNEDVHRFGIAFGNKHSSLQFTFLLSLQCQPCVKAFDIFKKMVLEHGGDVGCKIIFSAKNADLTNSTNNQLKFFLNVLTADQTPEYKMSILGEWYTRANYERFKTSHESEYDKSRENDVEELIKNFQTFILSARLKKTPAVFVNQWKLPQEYVIDDILNLSRYLSSEDMDFDGEILTNLETATSLTQNNS